jgi:hypothetical protein
MEYMFVVATDESVAAPTPSEPDFAVRMGAWTDYTAMLMQGGHWLAGASLQPSETATTVRVPAGGAPVIVDGPFIEAKEQIAGFYVIAAADLDEALEIAAKCPMGSGAVEVRPIAFRPPAPGSQS